MSTSIVGWSCCTKDSKVEAPMLSPALTNADVERSVPRSSSSAPASTAAPAASPARGVGLLRDCAMRPWKSLTS
ncbi:hypothetical protein [Curtobacterium sp. VKM Ac-2922]|uniref:hypothetical protein n=1 Tax=Curtobacterium sp. VKM Ac-2922 TaxID=2929475 RepID=UPI001FB2B979|nr:hypothetical protein [Curtobacterium sp. VKM Ac-2922]MCJ1714206.1 hypothetical protein [Curtobacterium sp. VKM Ac-2922]